MDEVEKNWRREARPWVVFESVKTPFSFNGSMPKRRLVGRHSGSCIADMHEEMHFIRGLSVPGFSQKSVTKFLNLHFARCGHLFQNHLSFTMPLIEQPFDICEIL